MLQRIDRNSTRTQDAHGGPRDDDERDQRCLAHRTGGEENRRASFRRATGLGVSRLGGGRRPADVGSSTAGSGGAVSSRGAPRAPDIGGIARTGTAAVEMGAILLVIAVGTLAGVSGIGSEVGESYNNTADAVKNATK